MYLHLQGFDGLPIEAQILRDGANRRVVAASADVEGETLGLERIVCQPWKFLLLHGVAPAAEDASDLDLQEDAGVAAGEVAEAASLRS
jgi:hypothetical protein